MMWRFCVAAPKFFQSLKGITLYALQTDYCEKSVFARYNSIMRNAMYGGIYPDADGLELTAIAQEDIPLTKMMTEITEHQLLQVILFERALIKAIRIEQGSGSREDFT